MNAPAERIVLVAGQPHGGGIFLGNFFLGDEAFRLIGAPKAEGELDSIIWNKSYDQVAGALSLYDGRANTLAMAEAGSKLANWALGLRIGEQNDWHVPSRGEALLAFAAELKGIEAFDKNEAYWTSTQDADDPHWAWYQWFDNGNQYSDGKDGKLRVRAVRREPIQLFQK